LSPPCRLRRSARWPSGTPLTGGSAGPARTAGACLGPPPHNASTVRASATSAEACVYPSCAHRRTNGIPCVMVTLPRVRRARITRNKRRGFSRRRAKRAFALGEIEEPVENAHSEAQAV